MRTSQPKPKNGVSMLPIKKTVPALPLTVVKTTPDLAQTFLEADLNAEACRKLLERATMNEVLLPAGCLVTMGTDEHDLVRLSADEMYMAKSFPLLVADDG